MWGTAPAQEMESAAATATGLGVVVFAASGDNDSSDGGSTPANVDVLRPVRSFLSSAALSDWRAKTAVAFHVITTGENGLYSAAPGPDARSGLRSPIGTSLAKIFVMPK